MRPGPSSGRGSTTNVAAGRTSPPEWSADGAAVVWSSDDSVDVATGERRRLSEDDEIAQVVPSPDGARLALRRANDDDDLRIDVRILDLSSQSR